MNIQEQEEWLEVRSGKLYAAKDYFHHHAHNVLKTHDETLKELKDCFTSAISIKTTIRKRKNIPYVGINADDLNAKLRELLVNKFSHAVKFEVNEEKGVFYFSANKGSIGGFDFAMINHQKNITSLRNLCFGELHYEDGQSKWDNFLNINPELVDIANELEARSTQGVDAEYEESGEEHPLVVGEIQFGNWALVYRDFFKVLKANVQNSIDCLVYVVPTGNLESLLSDGIVTYDKTVTILKDFEKVISVPVWVIGIDLKLPKSYI